jgi:hypothetical protein
VFTVMAMMRQPRLAAAVDAQFQYRNKAPALDSGLWEDKQYLFRVVILTDHSTLFGDF